MDGNMSQYRIFTVVAQTGSISGAARKLFISQPAVSKSISSLEERIGVSLFIRGARGVSLTDEGMILYQHVSEAFSSLEAGEAELKRYHKLGIGHLTIGASTTLSRFRLLPYLREFTDRYPHISLGISCQPTIQTLEMIENGSIDIGLIARQDNMSNIEFFSLGRIYDIFAATPAYVKNLAIRSRNDWLDSYVEGLDRSSSGKGQADNESEYMQDIGLKLLDRSTLLLLDSGNATRRFVDYYLEENHIHPENMIEVSTMDLLIEFAKTGLGVACLIKNFVQEELRSGTLINLPAGCGMDPREIGFAWNRQRPASRSLEIFQNFIHSFRPKEYFAD